MPKTAPGKAPAIKAEVDAWFNDTFHVHGPALPEHVLAHYLAAKDRLTARLVALFEQEG